MQPISNAENTTMLMNHWLFSDDPTGEKFAFIDPVANEIFGVVNDRIIDQVII